LKRRSLNKKAIQKNAPYAAFLMRRLVGAGFVRVNAALMQSVFRTEKVNKNAVKIKESCQKIRLYNYW
jgi:hypothetical protein